MWAFSLYPEAAEGGGCLSVRRSVVAASDRPPNVERAQEEAARRARAKVRRYGAANRLNRLGTLTYRGEGCHDPVALRSDLGAFFRELRDGLGAGPLPYVWVPQWHPGGHGLHAHFAVGRFVPRGLIERSGGTASCTSSCSTGCRSAPASWRRRDWRPAIWPATRAAISATSAGRRACTVTRSRRGSSRTRSSATACSAEDVIERASGVMGSLAGAGLAVVVGGGVAWAARLLGAVGLTT